MLCVSKKSSFFVFFLTQNMNTMYTAVSGIISYGRWHIQAAIAVFLINAVCATDPVKISVKIVDTLCFGCSRRIRKDRIRFAID